MEPRSLGQGAQRKTPSAESRDRRPGLSSAQAGIQVHVTLPPAALTEQGTRGRACGFSGHLIDAGSPLGRQAIASKPEVPENLDFWSYQFSE